MDSPLQNLWGFFFADWKFKMAAISGYNFNMGKCLKIFSSETSKPIESKHCMDGPSIVLYKIYVFGVNRKFKMAAISRRSFNIGPYGKMFENFLL